MNVKLNCCPINENSLSCLVYVLSCIWLFPLSNFILPLILWLLLKDKSPVFDQHGKNLLNFQITWGLVIFVMWLLLLICSRNIYFFLSKGFGLFALMLIVVIAAILIGIAAILAYQGKTFKYLFAYQFIK